MGETKAGKLAGDRGRLRGTRYGEISPLNSSARARIESGLGRKKRFREGREES